MSGQISKKRKFVADGVFRAELNEFFTRELAEEGYSGCDVRVTHARTEVCRGCASSYRRSVSYLTLT
jgi:ribosomal protein S3